MNDEREQENEQWLLEYQAYIESLENSDFWDDYEREMAAGLRSTEETKDGHDAIRGK